MKVRQFNAKRDKMSHCALIAATIWLIAGRPIDSPIQAAAPKPLCLVVVLYAEAADGSPGNAQASQGVRSTCEKTQFDINWETVARRTFREFAQNVSVQYLAGLRMPELLAVVTNLHDLSIIYYLHAFENVDGTLHMLADVLTQIFAVTSAPIYSHVDKWYIIGAAAVCAVQGILIVVLIVQRRRRARSESRILKELQELGGRLFVAQESERKRIARELHDDFGQTLALLSVEMDLMDQSPDKSNEFLGPRIEAMSARVKQLSTSIHELSHQLHPIKLEQLGLVTALGSLCKELSRTHGLTITFSHDVIPALTPEKSLCIYRVAQEALSNAIRHSGATAVSVGLAAAQSVISLQISDDGCGFDLAAIAKNEGLGLVSIRERLRAVNGSLVVDAKPSQGTRLKIDIPLTHDAKKL